MRKSLLFVIILLLVGLAFTWHYARYDYIYQAADTSNLCDSWQEYNIYTDLISGKRVPIVWAGWKESVGIINSALTTTRLPAIIQTTTGWDSELVFRYFAIPIVVWLPVVVYFLASKYVSKTGAFVVGLLFILQPNFRGAPGYARIVIAELFVALAVYVLVSKLRIRHSIPLLVVLAGAITVTHYATAFITVPFLLMWSVIMMVRKQDTLVLNSFLLTVLVFCVVWHHWVSYASGDYAATTVARAVPYLLNVTGTVNAATTRGRSIIGSFLYLTPWIKLQTVVIWLIEATTMLGLLLNFKSHKYLVGAVISALALISTGYWLPPVADGYGVGRILFYGSPVMLAFVAVTTEKVVKSVGSKTMIDNWTSGLMRVAMVLDKVGVGYIPGSKPIFHAITELPWLPIRKKVWNIEGITMYLDAHESGAMRAIFRDYIKLKGKEALTTQLFKDKVKIGDTVVDVGANLGYYSLVAARLVGGSGEVYAFEPAPANYNVLIKNISLNSHANIIAINKAVSDVNGNAELYLSGSDVGAHTLRSQHNHPQFKLKTNGESIKVKTTTLDTVLGDTVVNVIKMDCEGAEMLAMRGADKIIRANPHIKIFSEFFPKAVAEMGCSPRDYLGMIKGYGFNITVIDELRLPSYKVIRMDDVDKILSFCEGDEKIVNLFLTREK